MKVGAVDIGTNSMRLLITDGIEEVGRWVEVTGLGRGVDATGDLADDAMERTLDALAGFGRLMDQHGVSRRKAIATSASRDASNREVFFDRAQLVLGVRPTLISGDEEAALAYDGATSGKAFPEPVLVSDIGGGSTEFVGSQSRVSVDIGSVRLTDRQLHDHPATTAEISTARTTVTGIFAPVDMGRCRTLIGVAGTWTSLGALALGLPSYDREQVHLSRIKVTRLTELVEMLALLALNEIASLPALDSKRAPVILAGAVIAERVAAHLGVTEVIVSEHDTLDAVAATLLALS